MVKKGLVKYTFKSRTVSLHLFYAFFTQENKHGIYNGLKKQKLRFTHKKTENHKLSQTKID